MSEKKKKDLFWAPFITVSSGPLVTTWCHSWAVCFPAAPINNSITSASQTAKTLWKQDFQKSFVALGNFFWLMAFVHTKKKEICTVVRQNRPEPKLKLSYRNLKKKMLHVQENPAFLKHSQPCIYMSLIYFIRFFPSFWLKLMYVASVL